MVTTNGGYADDVWISRSYFNPNIEQVVIEKFSSPTRINDKRATISFSGVCQTIQIKDVDIYKLEMEDDIQQHFDELPRQRDQFSPSMWILARIEAERIDLAAKGKVYMLEATDLRASRSFNLYQAGGSITNSSLAAGSGFRLIRLNDFVFDGVTWQFEPDETGSVGGIRPRRRMAIRATSPSGITSSRSRALPRAARLSTANIQNPGGSNQRMK